MGYTELKIEGRNPVIEAYRSGKTIDKLFVLDGCQDGPVKTITREARKQHTIISYVSKERLDQLSETHHHQGVIAIAAAYDYASVDDILAKAREKGEAPFIFLLDAQPGCYHPNSESCRCPRCHHSEAPRRRSDRHRGQNIRRCSEFYTGCQSDESWSSYG